jgi:hypothetical protein
MTPKDSQNTETCPPDLWDRRYGRTLTPSERKELNENLSGYILFLYKHRLRQDSTSTLKSE